MRLIDSHCHLDLAQFDEDREAVLAHAQESGVRFIINPGIDLPHSQQAIALAERYDCIYAAVGIHPNSNGLFADEKEGEQAIETLRTMAQHPKVVSIGEIGLDYYWDKVEPPIQKIGFQMQLSLALEVGLPVIIHSRDSNDDVAEILSQWVNGSSFADSPLAERPFAGVLHAFSGDINMAADAYEWGFLLSLGGPVTFKNAKALHELVPQLRQDRLMIETDAPFLTPHPHRGQRNQPAYVDLVCQRLAELYSVSAEEVATKSSDLAQQFFDIP